MCVCVCFLVTHCMTLFYLHSVKNDLPSCDLMSAASHIRGLMRGIYDMTRFLFINNPHLLFLSFSSFAFSVSLSTRSIATLCSFITLLPLSHCIQQILESVHHCHVNGIVHRDLKVCTTAAAAAPKFRCDSVQQMATLRKAPVTPLAASTHFAFLCC